MQRNVHYNVHNPLLKGQRVWLVIIGFWLLPVKLRESLQIFFREEHFQWCLIAEKPIKIGNYYLESPVDSEY